MQPKFGKCICHACIEKYNLRDENINLPLSSTQMILCPFCGNKRCPHASDHKNPCTKSNAPNQEGSIYMDKPAQLNLFQLEHIEQKLPEEKEVNLHATIDGEVWAKEFLRLFGGERRAEIDLGLMISWFANALMTGYDEGCRRTIKEQAA